MRKERRRRKQQKNISYSRLVGIICLLLGLLFTAALSLTPEDGKLHYAYLVELNLLGKGIFLLPFAFFAMSWQLLRGQFGVFNKRTLIFTLVTLCLTGTAHHVFVPVGSELEPSLIAKGGGLVGGLLMKLLHTFAGDITIYIILALGWLWLLGLVLPLRKWWELWQDYLTSDDLTLVRPGDKVQEERKRPVEEATQPVFKRKSYKAVNEPADNVINTYTSPEFDAFNEGVQKKSGFRSILSFKKNKSVYEQSPLKEELERDPVQLPDWEKSSPEVVFTPVINYDYDAGYEPDSRFLDDAEPSLVEPKQEPVAEPPEVEPEFEMQPEPERPASIIQDLHLEERSVAPVEPAYYEATVEPEPMPEQVPAMTIYDSADKITAADVAEQPAGAEPADGSSYKLPPLELLDKPKVSDRSTFQKDIMDQRAILEQTLADFKVRANVIAATRGPSVTRFELQPAAGVKVSSVVNLADDIALRLAAPGVRIEAPIPGKSAIGIEAPNTKNDPVCFREVVEASNVRNAKEHLCIGLGKDISGDIISADLAKMPHLLVAGSTGSGKSVCINTIIAGILYRATPDEVKLILVDPKVVELSNYNGIPHLLTPVVTEPKKAASALHWAVAEMERRYKAFADSRVRDIKTYNAQAAEKMPYIVIIIDELSDLMMVAKVDVEDAILRLAQKARAAGIHLIIATQRPSVDVITGIVKANIPSRIAFAVSSQTDSRTILDMGGAEKLLGKGDMLFYPMGYNKPVRVQGAFVSDDELNKIVDFIIKQSIPVNYSEEVTEQELECDNKGHNAEDAGSNAPAEDELFEDALSLVLDMGQASSSMLQRRFRIGYTRAARLVDTMEELGIVGQSVGSKPREVIMSRKEAEERFLRRE
ncbi:DNA translocase FtsK [Phascolarctobacterium succinatutens]|uniref:DNA translocase FtsK n=1 Tax=Phascolarctobacterium succinatutens TaxID=626940 RepID=UPI0025DA135A|nr:DNA translocase FtsK [Phascolarctobacterium succinatutens]